MRRAGQLMPQILEPDNLRLAFWKASRGKRYSKAVLKYQLNLDDNLEKLGSQISTGLVEVGDYHYFRIFEPKERQICASAFSEQVLHHAMMNVCHDIFERHLVHDTYATRKGKGVYAALLRAGEFTRTNRYYLKLDVRKFFDSVHHDTLMMQLSRLFREQKVLEIFHKITDSYEASPGRGLPIGNLTSQYFANHFLSGLDHHIKEELRLRAYVRYMDDMVLWSNEKEVLERALVSISGFIHDRLHCRLKPVVLEKCGRGLSFLGYRLFPAIIILNRQSKQRFIKKIRMVEEKYDSGLWTESECQRRALPLIAFLDHARTRNFRKTVLLGQWSNTVRATTV